MDLFKLVGSIYIDNEAANDSLQKTGDTADSTSSKLGDIAKKAGTMAVGVAGAATAAGAALLNMATDASANLDAIQKGAQKMDLSYEEYQKLSYACDHSGMSIESLKKGVTNITSALADSANGVEGATDAYEALGVATKNADGSMRSTEDVLNDTILALAGMDDETQRNAAAADIFGKSYTEMLPLLNSGTEGITDMMQACEDLGLVMSDEAVDAGAAFGDQMDDVKNSFTSVCTQIGTELMPVISEVLSWVLEHMPEIQSAIRTAINIITPILQVLIKIIQKILEVASDVIPKVINFFLELATKIKNTVDGIKTSIKNAINGVITLVNSFIEGINKIKVPDWIPVIGGKGISINPIPLLAKGGEVSGAGSAVVGEAGPEIVSLPSGAKVNPLTGSNSSGNDVLEVMKNVLEELKAQREELAALQNLQVVMDSGELVGVLNNGLGQTYRRSLINA